MRNNVVVRVVAVKLEVVVEETVVEQVQAGRWWRAQSHQGRLVASGGDSKSV